MQDLYSREDLDRISAQLKKRYLLLGCGLAVILVLIILSFSVRVEWLSILSVFLFFSVAVFVIELLCMPLHRYNKLLTSALTGRTHTETLTFDSVEPETSLVDGVPCRGLIFLGEPDKHGAREQRFYWDQELSLPSFAAGQPVTLKYTGRNIIGYQA